MSDLISKIRSAQIRAGEDAVCDHLREMGLLDDQKPIAGVHRPMTAVEVAEDLEAGLNSYGSCSLAAKLLRQQHAEIERLKAQFDPTTHAHRPDCCGPHIDTHCMGCTMAEREAHAAEIDRLKRERHHIYDLLARIHRDGGQYTAEHGVEKSCDDAEAQVVTWIETIGGADALIEQARIAEREACAVVCDDLCRMLPGTKSGSMLHFAAKRIRARSAT